MMEDAMTGMVEVSVRLFYTGDEADVTPKITVVLPTGALTGTEHAPDWGSVVELVRKQIVGIPVTGLREMTQSEVKVYREEEANDG